MRSHVPTEVPATPEQLITRLKIRGLVVRSAWFPTGRDIEAWRMLGCPLYTQISPQGEEVVFQVGPRLGATWASVFSPIWVIRASPSPSGSVLSWSRSLLPLTIALLVAWVGLDLVWGAVLSLGYLSNTAPWFGLIAFATIAAPAVGWIMGGRALEDGLPWLTEILLAPDEEEDW